MSATENVLKTLNDHFDKAMADGDTAEAAIWQFCKDNLNTMQNWMQWRASLSKGTTTAPTPPADAPAPTPAPVVKAPEEDPKTSFYQRGGETLVMVAPGRKPGSSYKQQIERNTAFIFAQTLMDKHDDGFVRSDAVSLGREDFSLPDYKPLLVIRWLIDAGVIDATSRGKTMTFSATDLHDNMKEAWATLSEYPS